MYPSFRGGNDNPGFKEGCFGEVDDVVAAADYLAQQDFVDPKRLYIGGHSTGGTLALLVAATCDRFRGVFSFGPVESVGAYGAENLPFDTTIRRELELRAPVLWMNSIRCPTLVFEGAQGNFASFKTLSRHTTNPVVRFHAVPGDHFSILAPLTRLIASKILGNEGPSCNIAFTEKELNDAIAK